MDALSAVYLQYWLQRDCEANFRKHLHIIKKTFDEAKFIGEDGSKMLIPLVFDSSTLEEQPWFTLFMLWNSITVMEPSFEMNPLTKLWRTFDAKFALAKNFTKYSKLIKIVMIHVLGSMEFECYFLSLSFLKDRVWNCLDGHLGHWVWQLACVHKYIHFKIFLIMHISSNWLIL